MTIDSSRTKQLMAFCGYRVYADTLDYRLKIDVNTIMDCFLFPPD